jgi:hypothetical protein
MRKIPEKPAERYSCRDAGSRGRLEYQSVSIFIGLPIFFPTGRPNLITGAGKVARQYGAKEI